MRIPLAATSRQGFDDNVEVVTEFRTLAGRADVQARADLRNLWEYRDYIPKNQRCSAG